MRSEIKIGLLGLAALGVLIFGFKFLKGQNIFEKSQNYFIRYTDVQQLAVSDGVFIHGFKVGSVLDIYLEPDDANFLIVHINVEGDLKLPKDTRAVLMPKSIMGSMLIELEFDQVCKTNCLDGDSIITGTTTSMLSTMLGEPDKLKAYYTSMKSTLDSDEKLKATMGDIENTIRNLNKISEQLTTLLSSSQQSLTNVIKNTDKITSEIANNKESLSQSIKNIETFSENLKNLEVDSLMDKIDATVTSVDQSVQKFKTTLEQTNGSLKHVKAIMADLSEGKGSMGRILKDETLANNLDRVTKNLDLLLQDIRLNPKRYINVSVFGKKQKDYSVPKDDPAFVPGKD